MKTIAQLSDSIEFNISKLTDVKTKVTFRKLLDRQFDLYYLDLVKLTKALTFIEGSLEKEVQQYVDKNYH